MPNEDFSIKTGIEVDDSGVSQLKSITDELEKTAKALQKINNVKFNGDIFSGLTNAGKNIQNVTKEIDKLQKSANGAGKVFDRDDFLSGKSFVTKNKKDATSQLRESYKERMALQKSLENTDDKNGIWFSKEYLEADYKYLQSIKEAAAKGINKSTFDKYASNSFYKYGASDIEDDLKEANLALQDYYSTIDEIKKENKIDFIPKDIENKITQVVRAKSNLRSQLDNDPDYWKDNIKFWKDDIKYDIDNLKFDGKLTPPKIDTSNITEAKQEIEGTKKDLSAISSGEYSLLDVASIDAIKGSMESIATSAQNLKETLGSEVTSGLMIQINEMLSKKDELQDLANILKSNKEDLNKAAKATGSKKSNTGASSTSTSTKTTKYITDQSYVGDYKTLADNEAFTRTLDAFRHNTTEAQAAIEERNKIMARVKEKAPQNTAETNTKQRFDDIDKTITDNISKYGDRIKSAYAAFDKIKADKSGIAGIGDVFKSSEEQINKWATAVAKGKMGIDEFEKKVSGLNGSVGSIGKIIDPASITDAKGELESYLKELTNIQDITFSGFTEKNGIATLKGTFSAGAKEAQTLTAQLNTMNGQFNTMGTSIKPVENGLSKFFLSWKGGAAHLLKYIGTFRIAMQLWSAFKQGVQQVIDFDSALAEMRKVSTESVNSLKQFQKESFDVANSVGTTALQVQNSTADFLRLGESMAESKESAKNANKLLTISEFDNIDDATSALVSMKAAYKDLTEDQIIDKINAVGDNYAISTDQVATGLQKSGATLSLLGNNIDEAAALITAANTTLQNVDTVSAGIRTISLRIMGTEEAKKELEDLGEDTSDYVVETKAKKRQIIRDYTAVASNGGKGVDILDSNGNNRNMFDVMRDIGAIYKEIQEEDKKYQTNRAQALIEELAGSRN